MRSRPGFHIQTKLNVKPFSKALDAFSRILFINIYSMRKRMIIVIVHGALHQVPNPEHLIKSF